MNFISGDARFIQMKTGKNLLMIDDYTFNVHSSSENTVRYKCSSASNKCNASVIIANDSEDIRIINYRNIHNHPPPQFYVNQNNKYVLIRTRKPRK